MNRLASKYFLSVKQSKGISGYLSYAGFRYWTVSLFPALVGTTLPFWLFPLGFSFKWFPAIEFLIATVLFYSGFSFLLAWSQNKTMPSWPKSRLLKYAGVCIIIACFLGLHLNSNMIFRSGVPNYIFMVYGLTALFAGVLYVLPPFNFNKRVGGEVIIAEGLGMIPVLGAYLVQIGDLTRTVYLASLPLVVATGLWVWLDELASKINDEKIGRKTMVIDFGLRLSGRVGVGVLSILFVLTLLLSVFSEALNPTALISLLLVGFLCKVVTVSWKEYALPGRMVEMVKIVSVLHFAIGSILVLSSLVTMFIKSGSI
jgi:1,4-dihydroxy-2-naphthoate octaprenyltransferase